MKTSIPRVMMCVVAALATVMLPASAAIVENDETDIVLVDFIPCAAGGAGEIVDLTGPLHVLVTATVNGNNLTGFFHFQPQGISGIGETTGDKYQATGVTQQSFKTSLVNGQANLTYVNNFRMIGQGSGNNFLVHETMHITINANGTITVFHDNLSTACK